MDCLTHVLIFSECILLITTIASGLKLTALNFEPLSYDLYLELKNKDAPAFRDAVILGPEYRENICQDIFEKEIFRLVLLDKEEVHRNESDPLYSNIFKKLYNLEPDNSYQYTNPYRQTALTFLVNDSDKHFHFEEYVFICPLKDLLTGYVNFFYVSKEYDLNPMGAPYMPGRFLLGNFLMGIKEEIDGHIPHTTLAEQPARPHFKTGFNVELHYLQKRKLNEPATNFWKDSLCNLSQHPRVYEYIDAHHHRICVAVVSSSYFIDEIEYPEFNYDPCHVRRIAFRTVEAIREAAGKVYYERMIACNSRSKEDPAITIRIYISRAYLSNHVFVYRHDPIDDNIYLENLSTNIIINESSSFDDVET